MFFPLPKSVIGILETLENAGFEAWCVGGCVRDLLRGEHPHDFDIATAATPETVKLLFARTADTGIRHGTVTVIKNGIPYEVTTYRKDGDYEHYRTPKGVQFVSEIKEDLARRDFTINAMAYHPARGLFDPYGGQHDLATRLMRTVGNPIERFSEDALRILRLFRFSARFDFPAEQKTFDAAVHCKNELFVISRERIAAELDGILTAAHPERADAFLQCGGLAFLHLFGQDSLAQLSALPSDKLLRFFAFCRCVGCDAVSLARELKSSRTLIRYCEMVNALYANLPDSRYEIKKALYSYGEKAVSDALLLAGKDPMAVTEILDRNEPYRLCELAVNGDTLRNYGISGREAGIMLKKMLDDVQKFPSHNSADILLSLFSVGTK